jgi:hypothetical protein
MAGVHVEHAETCVFIDVQPSGDVRVCGARAYGRWDGRSYVMAGYPLFTIDGDDLVIDDKHTMRLQGGEIVGITQNLTPDLRFHVSAAGEVLDGTGKHVATIRPAPRDPHVALAAFAMVENVAVLHGLADVVSFGKERACSCQTPAR